jgi:hypothetical protein
MLLVALCSVTSCASDPPKSPQAQPTYKDVRGDSDRFFDKMKQDEREQGSKNQPAP